MKAKGYNPSHQRSRKMIQTGRGAGGYFWWFTVVTILGLIVLGVVAFLVYRTKGQTIQRLTEMNEIVSRRAVTAETELKKLKEDTTKLREALVKRDNVIDATTGDTTSATGVATAHQKTTANNNNQQ